MIDRLRRVARVIERVAVPSLMFAGACFAYAVFIVFTSSSHEDDKYLFPSVLGFLWALSLYGFVETFKYVPEHGGNEPGILKRAKRRLSRLWYGLIGLVFFGSTVAVIVLTLRVSAVWLGEYGADRG